MTVHMYHTAGGKNLIFEFHDNLPIRESVEGYFILENLEKDGVQVVKVRKELGVTQKSLAAQAGVSQQEISRFEKEKHIPKLSNFLRILDALGLELKIEQKDNHVQ